MQDRWDAVERTVGHRSSASVVGGGTIAISPQEVSGGDHTIIGEDPRDAELALVGTA